MLLDTQIGRRAVYCAPLAPTQSCNWKEFRTNQYSFFIFPLKRHFLVYNFYPGCLLLFWAQKRQKCISPGEHLSISVIILSFCVIFMQSPWSSQFFFNIHLTNFIESVRCSGIHFLNFVCLLCATRTKTILDLKDFITNQCSSVDFSYLRKKPTNIYINNPFIFP